MDAKLLIIDDDRKLQKLVREYLEGYDFMIVSLYDGVGDRVSAAIREHQPDLIILDIMLPGKDGLEILRDLRHEHRLPVIMLTARGEDTDRIVGLELGADDYLAKPFNPRELLARIRAILRRTRTPQSGEGDGAQAADSARSAVAASSGEAGAGSAGSIVRCGPIELDHAKHVCRVNGRNLELSSAEFQLLRVLLEAPGVVLSRDELMNRTKGRDYMAFERSIDVHISKIRHKLESAGEANRIKTVWGAGYMLLENPEPADGAEPA
jgi:two-component system phosphate regulon response regulator OmpR